VRSYIGFFWLRTQFNCTNYMQKEEGEGRLPSFVLCPMGKTRNSKYAVRWLQNFSCTIKKRKVRADMLTCENLRSEYPHCLRLQDIKINTEVAGFIFVS